MTSPSSHSPIRAVLADDHAVVRAGIRQFLESGGIDVIAEAENGEIACALTETLHPDVVVLDINMPRRNGIEAARWIHGRLPQIGILILTAYDDIPYIQAVLRAGAQGYVLKTASPEEIIRAVREIYDGKTTLDPALHDAVDISSSVDKLSGEELSVRELEVLSLVARGFTSKAVAVNLEISERTAQNHLAHIYEKLHAASRTEAVMKAISLGILPPVQD
jgi:DNA-binding NarL/FixJ family response regulator